MKTAILALLCFLSFAGAAYAATNISATAGDHWAWNDAIGWIDLYSTGNVNLTAQRLTGYASSSVGDISFDCHTTRNGDICATVSYGVTNDGAGNLSGWAWNDGIGWISFDCNQTGGCASNYRVLVDTVTGVFSNYAWSEAVGWISFNCANHGACASDYRTVANWQATTTLGYLESSIFDTGTTGTGAKVNAVLWRGSQPAGTAVAFRFATATSAVPSSPWTYVGPDGTTGTSYSVAPDVWMPLSYSLHEGRYVRYRVELSSNQAQTLSPRVDEIVINWSP